MKTQQIKAIPAVRIVETSPNGEIECVASCTYAKIIRIVINTSLKAQLVLMECSLENKSNEHLIELNTRSFQNGSMHEHDMAANYTHDFLFTLHTPKKPMLVRFVVNEEPARNISARIEKDNLVMIILENKLSIEQVSIALRFFDLLYSIVSNDIREDQLSLHQ